MEQVLSESAVVAEGETVDSPGRCTGSRDGGAGGAGRARVRRGVRRRVGLAGVCRTRYVVRQSRQNQVGVVEHWLYHFSGTAGVLAVYASDVCQFRDKQADSTLEEGSHILTVITVDTSRHQQAHCE